MNSDYKKYIFLILLAISFTSLFSDSPRKKVFFDRLTIDIGRGIPEEVITRIVQEIGETIVRSYSDEYQYIDESVQQSLYKKLKEQQMLGCNTEACLKMIEDNIDADFKLTAKIRRKGKGYILVLKRIDLKNIGEVVSQRDIQFQDSNLEYYTKELTRAIFERDYSIRDQKDPSVLAFSNYFWKSALIPGSGQIALKREDERGEFFLKAGIGIAGFTALQYLRYNKHYTDYQSINPVPFFALAGNGNTELAYAYSSNAFSQKRESYSESVQLLNIGFLFYTLIWGANLIDLVYFSKIEPSTAGLNGFFTLSQSRTYSPLCPTCNDTQNYLQYTYRF